MRVGPSGGVTRGLGASQGPAHARGRFVAAALFAMTGLALVLFAMSGLAVSARAAPTPTPPRTSPVPAPGESVAKRLDRMLSLVAGRGAPLDALLALWEAADLAPLVPGGPTRVEAAAEALARRVQKATPTLASEAALAVVRLRALATAEDRGPKGLGTAAAAALAGLPTGGLVLGPLPGPGFGSKANGQAGKHGLTGWRRFVLPPTGALPLEDFLPSSGDAHAHVGLAFTTSALTTRVLLGSNGPMTATLDGQPLTSFDGERELADWQDAAAVDLAPGLHWLEVTVGHRSLAPELTVRVPGATFVDPGAAPPEATAGWTAARRLPPSLVDLAGPAPRDARSAAALARDAALARLAWRTDPAPPSERRAASRLEAAIAAMGAATHTSVALADLYDDLGRAETTDPSRAIAAFEAADRLVGGHAQALSALLDLAEKAGLQARASDLARRLRQVDPEHPALIGHDLLRRFELGDAAAALPLAEAALKKTPTARLLSLTATLAERAGRIEEAAQASAEVSASQLGASEPLERAARLYLRAGKKAAALSAIDRALALRPMAADLHLLRARTLASDGDTAGLAQAIAELDGLRAFHHQNPLFEELRGRLLILAGERGKAIEAFDRALELAPQNRELADYRRTLVEERGLADRWAEPIDAIVARARSLAARPEGALYVLERTVTEVFQSGLASQFRQLAIRIDQPKAAERFEDMIFPFTPGEDRLEVLEAEVVRKDGTRLRPRQIGEQRQEGKSEGVYTLTAYKVVRFPALEPGDIIHLQMRKDEIGSRNMFGDFFGVFFPVSSDLPKAKVELIVLAPASRPLHFGVHDLPAPKLSNEGESQRLDLTVTDLPALVIEPGMPGYGDVGAWLSVSTFSSWESLTTWYRELILPQIEVPPSLSKIAQGLVAGKTALVDKVAAIHRWVVTQTRYVGIEFGIHGFKPYKVAEIVQRGYGDCKDKASLLVALLREVGVPAEFVLVRTRDLGALDGTPATLWAFNHAIAYVPGLDLYLDGTAESSGIGELPELDQDALVLRFDLYSTAAPTLTRIPLQSPQSNKVTASARYVLEPSGDAAAELVETIAGTSAGRLRGRLQDATRRDALIAEIIAGQLPGTTLVSASYENLDTLGAPVTIRAKVTMPQLAKRVGNTLELPLVLEPGLRLNDLTPLSSRKQPLVIMLAELDENTDRYVLPAGAKLASVPEPIKVESRFGSWTMVVRMDGPELVTESRWELLGRRVSPAEYPELRRFLEDITRAESGRLRVLLP